MKTHPLFEAHPLTGEREISVGRVPTPYHIYDGRGMLLGGTADFKSVAALLENEAVYPLQTTEGRALAGVWVVDFHEASLGPHHELQLSFLVSHEPQPPIKPHPLALLRELFVNPAARMFCYGLWNNTETVVAYNRELLGLDAKLTQSRISYTDVRGAFHFADGQGALICEGEVGVSKRPSLKASYSLLRAIGFRQAMQALSAPYLEAKVVNPISEAVAINADAQTYLAADQPIIQFFEPTSDALRFGEVVPPQLDFQPQFVEHFAPFRFVYLTPQPAKEVA